MTEVTGRAVEDEQAEGMALLIFREGRLLVDGVDLLERRATARWLLSYLVLRQSETAAVRITNAEIERDVWEHRVRSGAQGSQGRALHVTEALQRFIQAARTRLPAGWRFEEGHAAGKSPASDDAPQRELAVYRILKGDREYLRLSRPDNTSLLLQLSPGVSVDLWTFRQALASRRPEALSLAEGLCNPDGILAERQERYGNVPGWIQSERKAFQRQLSWLREQRELPLLPDRISAPTEGVGPSVPGGPCFGAGSAPPPPRQFIGRALALHEMTERLSRSALRGEKRSVQVLTAIRGWPGVGKTTLAAALAHDEDVARCFPDGILWTSLGTNPDLRARLNAWERQLGLPAEHCSATVCDASARIAALLRSQKRLLIIDDAWSAEQARPFLVGGLGCATLVTTRSAAIAYELAPAEKDVYVLGVLEGEDAFELLAQLAPAVATQNRAACVELCEMLECLPLALQVAGRMLHQEARAGWDVARLLRDLRDGSLLLGEQTPIEYTDLLLETRPTVAALLRKSVDVLEAPTRLCFARLGAFAASPTVIAYEALASLWQGLPVNHDDVLRSLLARGLLEPLIMETQGILTRRYRIHALLRTFARALLTVEFGVER